MVRSWLPALAACLALGALACSPAEPGVPAPVATGAPPSAAAATTSTASPASSAGAPTSSASAPATSASAAVAPGAGASGSAPVPSDDPLAAVELVGPDGAPLPQTDDKPTATSPLFARRIALVWQAIVSDDPTVAEPAFFPKLAYEQVKDIKKPGADWKHRLLGNFARDVHEYHKALGREPEKARFLGVDVDDARAKWMKRGSEGNKLGYWRVTRSKLRFADAAGKERALELTSCISWRGEWYVVHLHGYK